MRHEKIYLKNVYTLTWFILGITLLLIFIVVFSKINLQNNWNSNNRLTLAIFSKSQKKSNHLIILSLDPKSNKAFYLLIPGEALFDVPFGYQTYQASSIYDLGLLDENKGGGKLLVRSIENTLGIVVDRYLVIKDNASILYPLTLNELQTVKKKYFSVIGLIPSLLYYFHHKSSIDTNLTVLDLIKFWNKYRQLRQTQINFDKLDNYQILTDKILLDKSLVKTIDKDLFDTIFYDTFWDSQIRLESVSIEIVNATNQEKVAAQFGRMIEHLGGNVIIKSNGSVIKDEVCIIEISDHKFKSSMIVKRIEQLLHCKINDVSDQTSYADIKIILGKGYIL